MNKGFTLVELSVVIVIIGLLTAGTLYGTSMIQSAREQKVAQEMLGYDQMVTRFNEQYHALPGDMVRASTYWGAACGNAACNGDGNRVISWNAGEGVKAWQHLALAKLVPGTFTGTGTTGNPGVNVPKSAYLEGGAFYLYGNGTTNFVGLMRNSGQPGDGSAPIVQPEMAFRMDGKTDDGKPSSGNLRASGTSCVASGEYNVAEVSQACELSLQLKTSSR